MAATAVEGDAESTVRVVIFEDLQGADCAKFQAMLDVTLLPRVTLYLFRPSQH